jgi:hypothetical protein
MNHRVNACAVLALLVAAGCKSMQAGSRDLATNEMLYAHTRFQTSAPGDRSIFVLPVRDSRDVSALPASNGAFPVMYDSDARWERPVRAMVEQVLRDELQQSAVFAGVTARAQGCDLLMQPTLVRFDSAVVETIEGGRSQAVISLRLQVYGPETGAGTRPLWFDRVFGDTELSGVSLVPMSTLVLMGRTMQTTMAQALAGLDGSNVGRIGVPLEPLTPEPAAKAAEGKDG